MQVRFFPKITLSDGQIRQKRLGLSKLYAVMALLNAIWFALAMVRGKSDSEMLALVLMAGCIAASIALRIRAKV